MKLIKIDEEKCNGCSSCVDACHEGALAIVDGKAKLVRADFCDGLGACIGECPQGALTIVDVETPPAKPRKQCECPGTALRTFSPPATEPKREGEAASQLSHWPVQLRLVPAEAPFLAGAHLLICADCVPFALNDFHERYLAGRVVLVGCPKLDDIEFYREKLARIFAAAHPASVTVLRMEVPCCSALAQAALDARENSLPEMPVSVHTIGVRGAIKSRT